MVKRVRGLRWCVAMLVALALLAAACGGDDDADSADGSETPAETGEATPQPEAAGPAEDSADEPTDSGTEAVDEPIRGGVVRYGTDIDGTGFDTTGAIQPGSTRFALTMVDALIAVDDAGDWHPNLAESLTPNEDATVWTMTLRDGVVFHDGSPVDAAAVKANLDGFKASPTVGFALGPMVGVAVVDPLTLEITMDQSWAGFPYQLVTQPGWVVAPDTIGTNDSMVSTGPFVFESWVPGDSFRAVRNENWWRADEGLPYLDAIEFKVIPEQVARRQALEAGDIDVYFSPSDADIVDFESVDDVVWYASGSNANEFLIVLNTLEAPVDDVRIRRAMAHAVDRDLLIENFRSGLTIPAAGPLSPVDRFYAETDYPEFDLDAAASLVEEYEAENGPAELVLLVQNRASVLEIAELMVSFWADAGLDVTIEPIEPGNDVNRVIGDAFQAVTWFQFSGADPDTLWVFMHSGGGFLNWSNLVDAELDAGLDQGRENFDPEVRQEGYTQFQERLTQVLPFIWFDHLGGVEGVAARPGYRGLLDAVTAEGVPVRALQNGSFHGYGGIWLEPES